MPIQLSAPKHLQHDILLPSSKSISNRALIINALSGNRILPHRLSDCDDTMVMLRALTEEHDPIDIMAAGTAMRFLTAYLAVSQGAKTITGTERMKQRPISVLVDALRSLGADIQYVEKDGFPPLFISGSALQGGHITLPGNVSSQYISALLMIAPTLKEGLIMELTGKIVSRPYIDMTLEIMRQFGADASWIDEKHICIKSKNYEPIPYDVEADWSAASYWYEILALSNDEKGSLVLKGLNEKSTQGDSAVHTLFAELGVKSHFFNDEQGMNCVQLTKCPRKIQRMEYNFVNQPDLAQTFVVTCAMLNIPFHFTGLESLKIKETDRITALIQELRKMGFVIKEANDSELFWDGEKDTPQPNIVIDTYDDHRMAMAFAPCAFVLPEICINHQEVVSKSYPQYWEHLKNIGFKITE
ncbi:MAG: 3-phosphoshikimate 1-carboxyvinyltransferase [Paraprevotella sp.]|nr:3-phosphoshikimate 1-carboxyvinyltransferase [Paraprevotella sp.]